MNIQNSRILIKRSTTTGVVPTIPVSDDHTDGSWLTTDIYKGELFINLVDGIVYSRDDSGVIIIYNSSGLIGRSPDGTEWLLTPDNTGNSVWTQI